MVVNTGPLETKNSILNKSFANTGPSVDFEAVADSGGNFIFRNLASGEEQSEQPAFGWVRVGQGEGEDPYYWNVGTGETQWEMP